MKKYFIPTFYLYERAMWYLGQAMNEARKPLQFMNEALLIVTFLTVKGWHISLWHSVLIYLLVLVVGAAVGKLITHIGIVAYNTRLNNVQNPEIVELLDIVKDIQKKIS
jgi:hypothetical protein